MNRVKLVIPTINDDIRDFRYLFNLWRQVKDRNLDVAFDFTGCRFLRQNAVAFLGGMARLIQDRGGRADFAWETLQGNIFMNLAQQGFLSAFGHTGGPWLGNSIPFRQDRRWDRDGLMHYLKLLWLGRGWVNVSRALQDAILGQVCEIYVNAFEHGESSIGVFSCGQHYPSLKRLKLTVVDFGVGIPPNVRRFFPYEDIPADRAMKWAFQPNTTTKPREIARGSGLDLLKRFVSANNGRMEMFSHDGMAIIDNDGERYQVQDVFFEGTLVNISLSCNDRYYRLAGEVPGGLLF